MRFANSVWFDKVSVWSLKYLDIVQFLLEFKNVCETQFGTPPIFLNRSKQTRNEKNMGSRSKGV
jgi:hypothetical protein